MVELQIQRLSPQDSVRTRGLIEDFKQRSLSEDSIRCLLSDQADVCLLTNHSNRARCSSSRHGEAVPETAMISCSSLLTIRIARVGLMQSLPALEIYLDRHTGSWEALFADTYKQVVEDWIARFKLPVQQRESNLHGARAIYAFWSR